MRRVLVLVTGALALAAAMPTAAQDLKAKGEKLFIDQKCTLCHSVAGKGNSKGGQVVIHGWKTPLPITAAEAVKALEPFCGEFLYTHVDKEGLMGGTDIDAILAVKNATTRHVTAAGGITTQEEIDGLDALGVDAVVGMALYTGKLKF